jgi:signal transduction histidine kinase/Fe-S-cluster-containing hydrogenase component 2
VKHSESLPLVTTIEERCRVCYTCVRECPAKAIRIAEGQAQVLTERCIGCGNCVRVCSQGAKQVLSGVARVRALLADDAPVAAMIAPSFPAEFPDVPAERFAGMLRALGFDRVHEVAFGADLVARKYREILSGEGRQRLIATTCPAIIGFVEKYHPQLVSALAPVVSPMIAMARVLRELAGPELRIVFVGPCIAKKTEASSELVPDELDGVLTFEELEAMLAEDGIDPARAEPSDFDPPHAAEGAVFPVSHGMLETARIGEEILEGRVVATSGGTNFIQAIREFESGDLDAELLEILCCDGCIMGAGMTTQAPLFSRRSRVAQYARRRLAAFDRGAWEAAMDRFAEIDLSRPFSRNDQRIPVPSKEEIQEILSRMGKETPQDELNCGACGYTTCVEHAIAIYKGLAEPEMCLPYTIEQLRETVGNLAERTHELADTREALIQSEKLASMGQLAAGIAHEVNNPLGVVLMYAHLLADEFAEDPRLQGDLSMIAEQADRCKRIVSGLLHFARQNKVIREPTNVRELVNQALRGIRAPEGITVETTHALSGEVAELDRDQVIQVLTNLVTNAIDAMGEEGTLTVRTEDEPETVRVIVADTGTGIPKETLAKIFDPFFTTKQIGFGTGLGLAVTYGIVKMHKGDITVTSNADPDAGPTGTTFTILLPRREADGAPPDAAGALAAGMEEQPPLGESTQT